MKHKQPTQEELQEKIREASELTEKDIPTEPEIAEEPVVETPEPVEEPKVEPQAEPSKEVKEQLKQEVIEKDKKLSASAREAQKLYAKNRVINKALIEADEMPEPTEEELVKEFGQDKWELMSEVERDLAKETVISRNWRKTISQAKEQATKIEKWNESIEEFVDDPTTLIDNPELEGKTNEFKEFATQETNNSVPIKILVSAFLHEHSAGKQPHKGKMFETGSGGSNEKPTPKSDVLTVEEGRQLREADYPKWKELLQAGKIAMI